MEKELIVFTHNDLDMAGTVLCIENKIPNIQKKYFYTNYGDITKIPLTQTGKVRRYVRESTLKDDYKYMIRKLELNTMEYLQLRKAFQGGFTHANPMYVLQECEDVTSYDFTSSYPTVMVSEK